MEREDFHIVIVDVLLNVKLRIINVYRSFRPPNRLSPDAFFIEQIKIIIFERPDKMNCECY